MSKLDHKKSRIWIEVASPLLEPTNKFGRLKSCVIRSTLPVVLRAPIFPWSCQGWLKDESLKLYKKKNGIESMEGLWEIELSWWKFLKPFHNDHLFQIYVYILSSQLRLIDLERPKSFHNCLGFYWLKLLCKFDVTVAWLSLNHDH